MEPAFQLGFLGSQFYEDFGVRSLRHTNLHAELSSNVLMGPAWHFGFFAYGHFLSDQIKAHRGMPTPVGVGIPQASFNLCTSPFSMTLSLREAFRTLREFSSSESGFPYSCSGQSELEFCL